MSVADEYYGTESHMDGLSIYDLRREKRELLPEDTKVSVEIRTLNQYFTCPVCYSILRDTVVTMECLHRFCRACIQKCLRIKRECPQCRTHCPSRRSLRPDPAFDRLIHSVYPDIDEYERAEDMVLSLERQSSTGSVARSAPEVPATAKRKRPTSEASSSPPRSAKRDSSAAKSALARQPPMDAPSGGIVSTAPPAASPAKSAQQPESATKGDGEKRGKISFKPHATASNLWPLRKGSFRTALTLQIKNLQKFFAKRFNQEAKPGSSPPMMPRVADNDVELFLVGPAGIEQVQETTTVEEMTKRCESLKLTLLYKLKDGATFDLVPVG